METNNASEKHKEIARVFIEQYNLTKGTHYEFGCFRGSMFSFPKQIWKNLEFYQVAFIEKEQNPVVAALKVLFHIYKRLIIEVVQPNPREEGVTDIPWPRVVEELINSVECDALRGIRCSQYLLIDGFASMKLSDADSYAHSYKENRLHLDKVVKSDKRHFARAGFLTKHLFKEIWLSYHDEKGVVRCLQIW